VESTINQVVSRRFVKKQQMQADLGLRAPIGSRSPVVVPKRRGEADLSAGALHTEAFDLGLQICVGILNEAPAHPREILKPA
jgi:hypothetical protein